MCLYFSIHYFHISLFSIFTLVRIVGGENSSTSYSWLRHLGLKCCNRGGKHKILTKSSPFFAMDLDIKGIFVTICFVIMGNIQWAQTQFPMVTHKFQQGIPNHKFDHIVNCIFMLVQKSIKAMSSQI